MGEKNPCWLALLALALSVQAERENFTDFVRLREHGSRAPPIDVTVFVLTRETNATKHAQIRAELGATGLVDVRLVPAIYYGDVHECMQAHSVEMIGCKVHRLNLAKRIGQLCSWIHRLLPAIVDHSDLALVLEDDFKLRPSLSDFKALLPRVVAELRRLSQLSAPHPRPIEELERMHFKGWGALSFGSPSAPWAAAQTPRDARLAPIGATWDLAYVGSCFERVLKLTECYLVGGEQQQRGSEPERPLWISDTVVAVCGHGFFATPTAAHVLRVGMQQWLDAGWEHMRTTLASRADCSEPLWQGAQHLDKTLNVDVSMRQARLAGWLRALHVWPLLVQQREKSAQRAYTYGKRKPPVCKEGPTLSEAYYRRREPVRAPARTS
jgi:hypothetical protein